MLEPASLCFCGWSCEGWPSLLDSAGLSGVLPPEHTCASGLEVSQLPLGRASLGKYVKRKLYSLLPSPLVPNPTYETHQIFNRHWEDIFFFPRTKGYQFIHWESAHLVCHQQDHHWPWLCPGDPLEQGPSPHLTNHVRGKDPTLCPQEEMPFPPASQDVLPWEQSSK